FFFFFFSKQRPLVVNACHLSSLYYSPSIVFSPPASFINRLLLCRILTLLPLFVSSLFIPFPTDNRFGLSRITVAGTVISLSLDLLSSRLLNFSSPLLSSRHLQPQHSILVLPMSPLSLALFVS
ncbi:hypothetical protein PFISCL1PPCAC_29224, partial [Pristionchus fissidentatus]